LLPDLDRDESPSTAGDGDPSDELVAELRRLVEAAGRQSDDWTVASVRRCRDLIWDRLGLTARWDGVVRAIARAGITEPVEYIVHLREETLIDAEATHRAPPSWCGDPLCDPQTHLRESDDGASVSRCAVCHPSLREPKR
jgi:hypothetical protein